MTSAQLVAYISPNCPNCVRLMETLGRVPSIRNRLRIVDVTDVSRLPPNHGITAVPTLVAGGRAMIGKEAFDYLSQFNEEMELDSISLGTGSLLFGDFSAPP